MKEKTKKTVVMTLDTNLIKLLNNHHYNKSNLVESLLKDFMKKAHNYHFND